MMSIVEFAKMETKVKLMIGYKDLWLSTLLSHCKS